MPSYRLYCLDRAGKITSAEWIEAENDDAALAAARALGKPAPCELWLRNRMIDRIEPANI
ncbi:MAG: hypothetical protein ABIQ98_02890 [Sphingomicrobium sp.]